MRLCGCLWHFNSNIKFALEMCCEHFSVLRKVAAHPRGQSASKCRWKELLGRVGRKGACDGQWALPADFLNKSKIEKEKIKLVAICTVQCALAATKLQAFSHRFS